MKKSNFRKAVILPTVFALSTVSLSSVAFAKENTSKNEPSQSINPTSSSENVTSEVLKGTEENWKKIKVTDHLNGTVEYLEKETNNKGEVYKIYSENGKQTHEVISTGDKITLDGKAINQNDVENIEGTVGNKASNGLIQPYVVINPGDSMYLISTTNDSYGADWGSVATCAALLSAFFAAPVGVFVTLASYIISYKIPEVWYTKYKYSDKAPYHPTIEVFTCLYKDPSRTKYIGMTSWYP